MIPIGLQYSNDDGVTFSTALEFEVINIRVSEINESDNTTNAITGRKYPRKFTYLYVTLMTEKDFFDPADATHGASADANWEDIEDVCRGLLIRLYNNDTTNFPNFDGHTEFNSDTNTNYLLVESSEPVFDNMDEHGANGQKRRRMRIELVSRDPV
jgi:hypothetical protein